MSERELRPPHPMPTQSDFAASAEMTEDYFQSHGGAWTHFYKTTLIDARDNQTTRSLFEAISSQARFVEPLDGNGFRTIDPQYGASRAFLAGMWTGGLLSKFIHGDVISYGSLHNSVSQSLPHPTYSSREHYEANGRFLLKIGHEGASLAGYEVRQYLDSWGEEIVSREEFRPLYTLGAGAILFASQEVYKQVHPVLQQEYEISRVSHEVSQFLSDMSDSSDN